MAVAEKDYQKLLVEVDAFNKKHAGKLPTIDGLVK